MKKIWLYLLLLFLVMILCVWQHAGNILLQSAQEEKSINTLVADTKKSVISYTIVQKEGRNYTLSGRFNTVAQQNEAAYIFTLEKSKVEMKETSTDTSLEERGGITLLEKIAPIFMEDFKEGKITFADEVFTVEGEIGSYKTKNQIQSILASTTVLSRDLTRVVLPEQPINFSIKREGKKNSLDGHFTNESQENILLKAIQKSNENVSISLLENKVLLDFGGIALAEKVIPFFMQNYTTGEITYKDKLFTVRGKAKSENVKHEMDKLLAGQTMPTKNLTVVDTAHLLKISEAEKAKEAAAAKETEMAAKALKSKEETAKALQKEEAKKNISKLLKVENIEFNTGKSTLTKKGQEVVDKLAIILKEYPKVRIEIGGHTDSDGSGSSNKDLSQKRVDSVKAEIITQGVDGHRIVAKGYGESMPIVPNTTAENKQKNRRVEIKIIGE